MEYLRERFAIIEDERHQGYIVHKLTDVLIIIMMSVLWGLDELAEIMIFAQKKREFPERKYEITEIPSKPTMNRILNMINGGEVAKVIIEIMKERTDILGDIIAFDGKTIRSTSKKGKAHSALQILTAYLTESGVVLGLKENQKTLHDDIALFIKDRINASEIGEFSTMEKNSGRIEKRACLKVSNIDWIASKNEWAGLKIVFAVNRVITTSEGVSDEMSYYISSLDVPAQKLLQIFRDHWKIESMHWMLDVVFSEDECSLLSENGHKALNIFRKLALLIHKQYLAKQPKKQSLKSNILACLLDESLLTAVLDNL